MGTVAITLIVLGVALLIAEIFIPSFGVTGILGLIAILGGVLLTAETVLQGVMLFVVILVIVLILMFIAYRLVASKRSPLVLKDVLNEDVPKSDLNYFLNMDGVALTTLRPSGKGDFDGVRLDVLTEGDFIRKGSKICVSSIEGKKIFVKENLEG